MAGLLSPRAVGRDSLLEGQLLERAKFFTMPESVILDLLRLYLEKKNLRPGGEP